MQYAPLFEFIDGDVDIVLGVKRVATEYRIAVMPVIIFGIFTIAIIL